MVKAKIIAVDTGNCNMKTPNFVFPSGLIESGHLPSIGGDVLTYNGREYAVVDQRKAQKDDKTKDEDYFISTLAAIGMELANDAKNEPAGNLSADTKVDVNAAIVARSLYPQNDCTDITLLVGLPPLHCKHMGTRFAYYFRNRRHPIRFTFNGIPMSIRIADVHVYPQAFSAIFTVWENFTDVRLLNVVDIGGYTVDVLQMTDFRPNMAVCTSLYSGTNTLFQKVNERVRATGSKNIPDAVIEGILLENKKVLHDCSLQRISLVQEVTGQFAREVLLEVSQSGLDLHEHKTVFVGGGSLLLKRHIENSGMVAKPYFADDVHANAKGYQILYKQRQAVQTKGS